MINSLQEICFQNSITIIASITAVIGILLIILIFLSKFKGRGIIFSTRQTQSRITERKIANGGIGLICIGLIGLLIGNLSFMSPKIDDVNLKDWEGNWSAYLEEFGDMTFNSQNKYELEFKVEKGKIKGVLYNERGRVQGGLERIRYQSGGTNFIRGKFGNNDGRKLEFEFMMFPNQRSFVGKYRERNKKDNWKLWISHKKK